MESGDKIGRYEIIRLLGAGGMGEVYLAFDPKLDRHVALKILSADAQKSPEKLRRFEKEARAASKLNHPNIMVIYEVGEDDGHTYIVNEYVEGVTLRTILENGTLRLDEILNYGSQIAAALVAAHAQNIIHRDIKPENVIIRPDSFLKILDFGLAKVSVQRTIGSENETAKQSETLPGIILGTVRYMSPEQAKALKVDPRTDIFSLGIVLYEMVTARTPFDGETNSDTLGNIIHREPEPVGRYANVDSKELERIISKSLKKDPETRYQTAKELLLDLNELKSALSSSHAPNPATEQNIETVKLPSPAQTGNVPISDTHSSNKPSAVRSLKGFGIAGILLVAIAATGYFLMFKPRSTSIRSVAVLPIENLSGDPEQEFFADGMTEALISNLSQVKSLKVISRTSAMRYKGTKLSLPAIAKELNVDAVIEGTVQRSEGKVVVTAQLIDPASDSTLWSRNYNRDLSDVLKLQGDIAQAIVFEIKTSITAEEKSRLTGEKSVDPDAYEAYAQGKYHLRKLNDQDLKLAVEYFQKATQIEPDYAAAFAAISEAYIELGIWGNLTFTESEAPARAAATKALELDPKSADGLASLASIKCNYDWDWAGSEKDVTRAIEIDPGNVVARRDYGFLLVALGRYDEAVTQILFVEQLDPLSSQTESDVGRILYRARRYEEAIPHFLKAAELDPSDRSIGPRLADVYTQLGRYDDALDVPSNEQDKRMNRRTAQIYALTGKREEALKAIADSKAVTTQTAIIYALLGDNDNAFRVLNELVGKRDSLIIYINAEVNLEKLHKDARWAPLMKKMNFPGY